MYLLRQVGSSDIHHVCRGCIAIIIYYQITTDMDFILKNIRKKNLEFGQYVGLFQSSLKVPTYYLS